MSGPEDRANASTVGNQKAKWNHQRSIGLLTDLLIKPDGLFSFQTNNQEIKSC